ncbi:MAG: hypothetical protein HQQ74_07855, partial [Methanoculleus bourgensis]|nr:hypothetical protein [Methanoculleus bourgensis]
MSLKRGLLLLGVLIALICTPATVCAAGDGCGEPYITVELKKPENYTYLNLTVEKIEILDFLDPKIVVAPILEEVKKDTSKTLHAPTVGKVTRTFTEGKGTYSNNGKEISVEIACKDSIHYLPGGYQNYRVYTEQTFPDFTFPNFSGVECEGDIRGNVLLLKSPEEELDRDECFVDFIKEAFKEGYLLTDEAVAYYNTTDVGRIIGNNLTYNKSNLTYTLVENEVNLPGFCPKISSIEGFAPGGVFNEYGPKPGEYLLTAVKYDSEQKTMHIFAATPVLILEKDTKVTWSGDGPYYLRSEKDVTVRFDNNKVDKIAYALVKKDPYYDLDVKVDTKELAQQGKDITTLGGLIPILNSITQPDGPVTYTLKPCGGEEADL